MPGDVALHSSSDQACYLEWQTQLFQKCDVARIATQILKQRVPFGACYSAVVLHISSLQPLKCFVGLISEGINVGDLEGGTRLILINKLAQSAVGLFLPTKCVIHNGLSL